MLDLFVALGYNLLVRFFLEALYYRVSLDDLFCSKLLSMFAWKGMVRQQARY